MIMRALLPSMAWMACAWLPLSLTASSPSALALPPTITRNNPQKHHEHSRRAAFVATSILSGCFLGAAVQQPAFASENAHSRPAARAAASAAVIGDGPGQSVKPIVYSPLSIAVDGVRVPVAAWHPRSREGRENNNALEVAASYEHRISVSKIAKKLVGWNLPSFLDRNFSLRSGSSSSSSSSIRVLAASGNEDPQLPKSAPVVLLAHGYLGSRFDLSHIGEALASEGFLVLSPEYPESLAASYDAAESATGMPIDRTIITNRLLDNLTGEWGVRPTSYGIVGHSLGCGTVDRTGDDTWTRVCLAGGYPSLRGSNCLFIGSIGDGAVSVDRALGALREYDFSSLDEQLVRSKSWSKLPPRSYLIFDNPLNAPNHISFLAEGTNDAMVGFLSPLLPVARFLKIPVLDFDRYQVSRDSGATGEAVVPLVVEYLKQTMRVS